MGRIVSGLLINRIFQDKATMNMKNLPRNVPGLPDFVPDDWGIRIIQYPAELLGTFLGTFPGIFLGTRVMYPPSWTKSIEHVRLAHGG